MLRNAVEAGNTIKFKLYLDTQNTSEGSLNSSWLCVSPYLWMPISLQVSRSLSCSGTVKLGITTLPSGPGAGRKRLRASTCFPTSFSSPPMTTSGRPLSRQNKACWENEFCFRNLRALSPAFLLLFLREWVLRWVEFWLGEGGSDELMKLVQSDASSMLSSLRGARGGEQGWTSASATGVAKVTWRSGTNRGTSGQWESDFTSSLTVGGGQCYYGWKDWFKLPALLASFNQ